MAEPRVLQDILRDLHRLGDFPAKPEGYQPNETHHRWPIVLYRTDYNVGSENKWEALITKVRSELVNTINEAAVPYESDGESTATDADKAKYEKQAKNLLELLDFHAISDAATLDGVSHDKLREVYKLFLEQENFTHRITRQRPFFVADTEVLGDDLKWIKCLDMPYDDDSDPEYLGWMKMVTDGIVELYSQLSSLAMYELAPETIGGMHLEIWEP